jgi:hypothetical protein
VFAAVLYSRCLLETMRGVRFLLQFLLVGMALFLFDTFSIAPMFATGASSVKVERHVAPEPLADTPASPSPNASTIVGTELTHSLDDGPAFLVCISAADLPLAGHLTACIIIEGSCPNTMSCSYLSTAVGGTGLCRIPAGNSTIGPCAFCRGAASTRTGRHSMTADDGMRKGARQVFEVAREEPFFEGKLGDADVKYEYSFPYGQTNVNEDAAGDPVEEAAKRDGVPLRWVKRFDGALVLLGLGLLGFILVAVCSEQDRCRPNKRSAIRSKTNRSYRNKWFELALLAYLVPRVADAQSAYFTVTSGLCTVDPSAPNCIRSPNFPSHYGVNEACSITSTALAIGSPLTATSFSTEAGWDILRIPSHPSGTLTSFSGGGGPSNFILGPGTIEWSQTADWVYTMSGWRVCVQLVREVAHARRLFHETSPPPSSPPLPPDLTLIPATAPPNVPTAITFAGNALIDGATCAFLPSGDDTCAGAAARRLFPTGGVLSSRSRNVSLGGPMFYKLCVAPAGLPANLDAHFTYVSSAELTVASSSLPPPPPPPP